MPELDKLLQRKLEVFEMWIVWMSSLWSTNYPVKMPLKLYAVFTYKNVKYRMIFKIPIQSLPQIHILFKNF